MSFFRELQELEDQGIDLIEVLGQDKHLASPEALQKVISQLGRNDDSLYAELLYYLTYRRFTQEQAESHWHAIMKHKAKLSEALGRKVAFRVAALDYLSSRHGILKQVRLVAKPEFESFLSFVNIDEVTAVYNRRYFNEILLHEVRRARRYESQLSLLILDLDDFKRVNDTLGHIEGDGVLRRTGRMLKESTRQTDSVCRYGGDEFAILLPETSGQEAHALAERIRKACAKTIPGAAKDDKVRFVPQAAEQAFGPTADGPERDLPRSLTLSIGGATYPIDCDEAEELVALADQMCLDAKRAGKDRVRMCPSGEGLDVAS